MLDEIDLARALLGHQSARSARPALHQVFRRTYWKGWMELRPAVWKGYQNDLLRLRDAVQTQSGLRAEWEAACLGQTGIAPFDRWAHELVQTGYLNTAARRCFASIWMFTLGLPWQLGADFFLRHLLDGDPAVNTLSWRWVAGLQTPDKPYLVTAEEIARHSADAVTGLAHHARPIDAAPLPAPGPLPVETTHAPEGRIGLLLHAQDSNPAFWSAETSPTALAYLAPAQGYSPWQMAPRVAAFQKAAAESQAGQSLAVLDSADQIANWVETHRLDQIALPYAPVGPVQDLIRAYGESPAACPISQHRRPLDSYAWPLATQGFSLFVRHIPQILNQFARPQGPLVLL